jgi:threonine aldolase
VDGARFANALVGLPGRSPADLTWKAGIDVLSLGTTKNGTLNGEMVVLFRNSPFFCEGTLLELKYRQKRAGLLVEKSRFTASQILGYFANDAWLRAATQANSMAVLLAGELSALPGVTIIQPVSINMVFVEMPKTMLDKLLDAGFEISLFAGSPEAQGVCTDPDMVRYRMCTNWSMTSADIRAFIAVASHA